jgi:tetratricopeptide (TPR) repeat protein
MLRLVNKAQLPRLSSVVRSSRLYTKDAKTFATDTEAIEYANKGMLYFNSGDRAKAFEHMKRGIELSCGNNTWEAHILSFLVIMHVKTTNYKDALNCVNKALEIRPTDVDILQLKTQIFHKQGEYESEIEVLDKLIEVEPSESVWYFRRANSLYLLAFEVTQKERTPQTLTSVENLLELAKQDFEIYLANQTDNSNERFSAIAHMRVGHYEKAIELFSQLNSGEYLESIAECYTKLKQFDKALQVYDQAIAYEKTTKNPNVVNIQVKKLVCEETMKHPSQELTFLEYSTLAKDKTLQEKVLSLQVDHTSENKFVASVEKLLREERSEIVLEEGERLLKITPNDKRGLFCLGRAHYDLKNFKKSAEYWKKFLEQRVNPTEARFAHFSLLRSSVELGFFEQALRYGLIAVKDPQLKASELQHVVILVLNALQKDTACIAEFVCNTPRFYETKLPREHYFSAMMALQEHGKKDELKKLINFIESDPELRPLIGVRRDLPWTKRIVRRISMIIYKYFKK